MPKSKIQYWSVQDGKFRLDGRGYWDYTKYLSFLDLLPESGYVSPYGEIDRTVGPITKWDQNAVVGVGPRPKGWDVVCSGATQPVISDRTKTVIESIAPGQVQFLPVQLVYRGRPIPEPFWTMNLLVMIDCLNIERIKHERTDNPHFISILGKLSIDPRAIPDGLHVFTPRYNHGLIISSTLKEAFEKAKIRGWWYRYAIPQALASSRTPKPKPLATLLKPFQNLKVEFTKSRPKKFQKPLPKPKPDSSMKSIVAYLCQERGADAGKAASQSQIKSMEKALGVTLPKRYKEFLLACGSLSIGADEVLGAKSGGSGGGQDAIVATMHMREFSEHWPKHMVCICDDGRGGWMCLDTSRTKDGDAPVVYFDHELAEPNDDGTITPVFERSANGFSAKSFSKWLMRRGADI